MAVPHTYLLVPPDGEAGDFFGRGLNSSELAERLRKINPLIVTSEVWANGPTQILSAQHLPGITCLWLGPAKITSMRIGVLPEYTQQGPDGLEVCKGWRAILEKVIKCGAATRGQVEQAFGVTLALMPKSLMCQECLRRGKRRKHNGGVRQLCRFHENARLASEKLREIADGRVEIEVRDDVQYSV